MRIDWWTLGIQTVNVAVLVWLLQRFFWRPVAAMIAKRRAAIQAALADAKAIDGKAKSALADVEKARAGFAAERDEIVKQAREAASKEAAAILADAARKAAALEAAGMATLAAERKAGERAWAERSASLAIEIAGRLAARLDGPAVQASFLAGLLKQLRTLPEATRMGLAGVALEAVTAAPIDTDDQGRTTGLIAEALGTTPLLAYRVDPALIAGLELHGPHLAVRNSWEADLASILLELSHDERT